MAQNPSFEKINSNSFNGMVLKSILTNTCPSYKEDLSGGFFLYMMKIDLHCTIMWVKAEKSPLEVWTILEAEIGERPDWFLDD